VLQAPAASVTAGIAADNLVVALYFMLLFALANKNGAVSPHPPPLSTEFGTNTPWLSDGSPYHLFPCSLFAQKWVTQIATEILVVALYFMSLFALANKNGAVSPPSPTTLD